MSRKNPRLVKVKTIIPSESIERLQASQGLHSRTIRKDISSLSSMVSNICDARDADIHCIIRELDSLRSFVEKSFIFVYVVLSLVALLTIL